MPFTSGNDLNILQATDTANVGAGAGNDTYVITPSSTSAGQAINLTDIQGVNTVWLIGGVKIASSTIAANAIQLKLDNGSTVNVFGADTFSYKLGGNPLLDPNGGVSQPFTVFATSTLGAAAIPNGSATASGSTGVSINVNGTITTDALPVFRLSPLASDVGEGDTGEQTQAIGVVVERNGYQGDLTVNLQVTQSSPASATAGVDFVAEVIPVTIYAGSDIGTADVRVLGDNLPESTETFTAKLVAGSQNVGSINTAASVATINIIDDDVVDQPLHQPSAQEQYMLELLNRARLDPVGEAALYGIDLNEGLAVGTLSSAPRQPLAFSDELTAAARAHSEDMLSRNFFAHVNPDGVSPSDRIQTAGYTYSTVGENIAYIATTASLTGALINSFVADSYESLFVDENYAGRGHRLNVLDDGFKEVGIGIQSGEFTSGGTTYNAVMSTQDFGTQPGAGAFLLGVVYGDTDGNSFYTPGEGVGSVMVEILNVDSNSAQTIYTMDAGGYQTELAPGTYDITYTIGNNTHFVDDLVVGVNNIKLDWVAGAAV